MRDGSELRRCEIEAAAREERNRKREGAEILRSERLRGRAAVSLR